MCLIYIRIGQSVLSAEIIHLSTDVLNMYSAPELTKALGNPQGTSQVPALRTLQSSKDGGGDK